MKRDPEYDAQRYQGRLLIAFLDQFVLSVALETPDETNVALNNLVKSAWGLEMEWRQAIIYKLELSPSILDSLKVMWENNTEIAKNTCQTLSPWGFAKMVTDSNFVPMLEGRA